LPPYTGGAAAAGVGAATLSTPLIVRAGLGAAAVIGGTIRTFCRSAAAASASEARAMVS